MSGLYFVKCMTPFHAKDLSLRGCYRFVCQESTLSFFTLSYAYLIPNILDISLISQTSLCDVREIKNSLTSFQDVWESLKYYGCLGWKAWHLKEMLRKCKMSGQSRIWQILVDSGPRHWITSVTFPRNVWQKRVLLGICRHPEGV